VGSDSVLLPETEFLPSVPAGTCTLLSASFQADLSASDALILPETVPAHHKAGLSIAKPTVASYVTDGIIPLFGPQLNKREEIADG